VPARHALQQRSLTDRVGAFGMFLAEATPEDRFKAFHADLTAKPDSVVGVLGECIVYGSWARMGLQAKKACDVAEPRLGQSAVLVELGRAASALTHAGDATAALAIVDTAQRRAPDCPALIVMKAQAAAAVPGADATAAWSAASTALPSCFRCFVEAATAAEQADTSATGRATAAPLWEKALALAPDHTDTLKRFAASVAGVDDARAQRAYVAAVKAGAKDAPTLLAAAKLTSTFASAAPPADRDALANEALAFAQKAADAAKGDPEPRRIIISLLTQLKRTDDAVAAANGLLLIDPEDATAHLALARISLERVAVKDAIVHYDAAFAASADGDAGHLDEATQGALKAERAALLKRLGVDEAKPFKGTASAVAAATQKALSVLWKDHVKAKQAKRGGVLTVVVETSKAGTTTSVEVTAYDADDPDIAAAAVAWLARANITGGARRYTLDFQLK